jgi:hypothetical protein
VSDASQGPGWWQASDGKWYPPETAAGATAPPPGAPTPSYGDNPKAHAKAAKAYAKAERPWYKKKRFIIPLALAALLVIIAATSGGGDDAKTASNEKSNDEPAGDGKTAADDNSSEADLFPNRPDEKDGDKERNVGDPADLSGYTVTVTKAARQQQISEFESDGYLVADVTLLNRDSSAQSYNTYDWKLITPAKTIIDPTITTADDLGSGDLAEGGTVSGQVVWEIGDTPGDYYVVYDPDFGGDHRGVWKVTV